MGYLARTILAATLSAGVAVCWSVAADAQEFKGTVKVGEHQLDVETGKIYEIELQSKPEKSLRLDVPGHNLVYEGSQFFMGQAKAWFIPNATKKATVFVLPMLVSPQGSSFEYSLKITPKEFTEKPILNERGNWTDQDEFYKERKSRYKGYKVNLKAGQMVVIDLVKGGPGIDPYLYLEDSTGKVVAQDDDSGGDLNARIVYFPKQDGEFRVIATTLADNRGPFTLTVRGTK